MAKPIRALEMHYPMMQFLITLNKKYYKIEVYILLCANPYPLTRMLFFFAASHTASNLWRLSDIEQFMFFLQAKTKDSHKTLWHKKYQKCTVLLSIHIKLVLMPSNATLKVFQLVWNHTIFFQCFCCKKRKEEKCRNDAKKNKMVSPHNYPWVTLSYCSWQEYTEIIVWMMHFLQM